MMSALNSFFTGESKTSKQANYEDISLLFDRLITIENPNANKDQSLTRIIEYLECGSDASCATPAINIQVIYDKILKHLQTKNNSSSGQLISALGDHNPGTLNTLSANNSVAEFLRLLTKLKAHQTNKSETKKCYDILSVLNQMAQENSRAAANGPSTSGRQNTPRGEDLLEILRSGPPNSGFYDGLTRQPLSTRGDLSSLFSRHDRPHHRIRAPEASSATRPSSYRNPFVRTVSESNALVADNSAGTQVCSNKGVPHNVSEDIVQEAIFSFTGIQGKYLKKDIISGKFKLDPRAKNLDLPLSSMLLNLSELGYYHDIVQIHTDTKSGLCALGLMGQGFVMALRNELTKYYGVVSLLQDQLNKQREMNEEVQSSTNRLTLLKLRAWYEVPLQRLQWLSLIAEECREKKGGALASKLYAFLGNGNPLVQALAKQLLLAVCRPMYQMLSHWLLEGEIRDTHSEFFIQCVTEVGLERLWHDKYRVRLPMLPVFISIDMANKILISGKNINFLCTICDDKQPVKGRDELRRCIEENAELIFSHVADTKLHSTLDTVYLNTSKRVLDILMGPHKLMEHFLAMRRYLLLGQGDFIFILMENLKNELDKPAKDLFAYDLSSIMDVAIRQSSVQTDDPEIVNHLDIKLMTPCDGDVGWDILTLVYTVRGPLATMLEPSMGIYQVLFKPLWRMKHMEFVLSLKIWRDQIYNARSLSSMKDELGNVLQRLHLFTAEMVHFIYQMQYYVLFEIIECQWTIFEERMRQAESLDDVLNAHDRYLAAIKSGAFLDSDSTAMCQHMDQIYDNITQLDAWQDSFYRTCFQELEARESFLADIVQSESDGEFGVTAEKQLTRDNERRIFEQVVNSCSRSLESIAGDCQKAVRAFILALNSNNENDLQNLGIRLDFSEYYKKRDQRLDVPLTYQHMRLSNVWQTSSSRSMLASKLSASHIN